ncbi:MAG: hypothetical protein IID05_13965 [Gemmatimonadetes bacterium]|nr:hypothetical protein [Gemmatimonadota bacterium]
MDGLDAWGRIRLQGLHHPDGQRFFESRVSLGRIQPHLGPADRQAGDSGGSCATGSHKYVTIPSHRLVGDKGPELVGLAIDAAIQGHDPQPYVEFLDTDAMPPIAPLLSFEMRMYRQQITNVFALSAPIPLSWRSRNKLEEYLKRSGYWTREQDAPLRVNATYDQTLEQLSAIEQLFADFDGATFDQLDRGVQKFDQLIDGNTLLEPLFRSFSPWRWSQHHSRWCLPRPPSKKPLAYSKPRRRTVAVTGS